MARVWEESSHSGSDLLMLLAIADFADDDGNAYPAVSTLARKCRMQPRNARYILQVLQTSGELKIVTNAGPKGANRYRVLPQGMQRSAGVQSLAGVQRSAATPAKDCREPLQRIAAEPSLNHHEPPSCAADHPTDGLAAGKVKAKRSTKPKEPGKTVATWQAYAEAYERRHGAKPLQNRTVNGQLATFVDQVGAADAPKVAAFYVASEDPFYLRAMHPINLLLRDASKLRTLWATGRTSSAPSGSGQHNRSVSSLWTSGNGQQGGAKPGKHAGFENLNYRDGVNADGSLI